MGSMLDYIFSGTLERFPDLVISYSEGQVGWMPYVIERADKLWAERGDNSFGTSLPHKPSSYIHHRIYGCVFDDEIGLKNRDAIGMDQICFETDYPHADSTFPHSKKVASDICTQAGLDEEETWKFLRGNAIRALRPRALRHHRVAVRSTVRTLRDADRQRGDAHDHGAARPRTARPCVEDPDLEVHPHRRPASRAPREQDDRGEGEHLHDLVGRGGRRGRSARRRSRRSPHGRPRASCSVAS